MLLSIQKDSNDIVFKCCGFPVYKCSKSNLYEINLNEMCEKDVITFIEEKYMD